MQLKQRIIVNTYIFGTKYFVFRNIQPSQIFSSLCTQAYNTVAIVQEVFFKALFPPNSFTARFGTLKIKYYFDVF